MLKVKKQMINAILAISIVFLAISGMAAAIEVDGRTDITYDNDYTEDARNQGELVGVNVYEIKINGDVVFNGDDIRTNFERGEAIDVRVKLMSEADEDNVEVIAMINGDDHDKIIDASEVFDTEAGVVYTKELSLDLSDLVERDDYKLRVMVANRYGAVKIYNYNLMIDSQKHQLQIRDAIFSPSNEVLAGRALLSIVRVKNLGQKTEKSVKVTVAIPELGLTASDYIDEVEMDDSVSSEELYLRIPTCAAAGMYTAKVTVTYDENSRSATKEYPIHVVASDSCNANVPSDGGVDKTVLTIGTEVQNIVKGGAGVVYPVSLTNLGAGTKVYSVMVDGAEWADVRVSPSNVVTVDSQSTKTVYVYVSAKDDAAVGDHMFSVTVTSGSEVLKQVPLKATVSGGEKTTNARQALEIALIVLIIILVIVGLVIAFSRMRTDDGDDQTQTYY